MSEQQAVPGIPLSMDLDLFTEEDYKIAQDKEGENIVIIIEKEPENE